MFYIHVDVGRVVVAEAQENLHLSDGLEAVLVGKGRHLPRYGSADHVAQHLSYKLHLRGKQHRIGSIARQLVPSKDFRDLAKVAEVRDCCHWCVWQ